MQKVIEVSELCFAYEERPERRVLGGVSFDVEEASITVITGASGCGKSTVCDILTGVIPNYKEGELSGSVKICGEEMIGASIGKISEKVGYVMQDPDSQIVCTAVEDELAFGPENICLPPDGIEARVSGVLEDLRMTELRYSDPSELSGGQKQLVAIGSVLALAPDIIVMDEPFAHLDEEKKEILKRVMIRMRDSGTTFFVAEHDPEDIMFADAFISGEYYGDI